MSQTFKSDKLVPQCSFEKGRQQVVLLACGSFSPITHLHLRMFEMAKDLLEDTGLFQVVGGYLSPVSDGYQKAGLAVAKHRLEMCELATSDSNWLAVDRWEALQSTSQRTVEVLDHLSLALATYYRSEHVRVMLLAGADLMHSFEVQGLWDAADLERILGFYGVVVVERRTFDVAEFVLASRLLWKYRRNIRIVKQYIHNDISSTNIRLFVRNGLSIRYLLPDSVIAYINKHQLYREGPE